MNWFEKVEKPKTQLIYQSKVLSIRGISSSIKTKDLDLEKNTEKPKILQSNYNYSRSDQNKILEYFETIADTKSYCQECLDFCKEKFVLFSRHQKFTKFLRTLQQQYNPDWLYNLTVLNKDLKLVREMKSLLKKIIENPLGAYEFNENFEENSENWKTEITNLLKVVQTQPRAHKAYIKLQFRRVLGRCFSE